MKNYRKMSLINYPLRMLIFLSILPLFNSSGQIVRYHASGGNEYHSQSPAAKEGSFHLYLSVSDRQTILHYTGNRENGSLTLTDSAAVDGTCGSLTVSPDKQWLYASVRSRESIASFSIEKQTGTLKPVSEIKAAGNPVYLSCDKSGRYLLSAYYSDNRVAVYQIKAGGDLMPEALQILEVPEKPHYINTDRSGRYVFVPVLGADMILQYIPDPATGTLSPNDPPMVKTAEGAGPRHLAFHPFLPYCYGVNELNSTVSVYALDEEKGTLKEITTRSNLPDDFQGSNTCADVHVSPDGKHLYTSNRGHNSIAAYSIDAGNGTLTPIAYAPTEKTPRAFAIEPSGQYLYAAGQDSGGLAAYRLNPSGEPELSGVYHPGGTLMWVEILEEAR